MTKNKVCHSVISLILNRFSKTYLAIVNHIVFGLEEREKFVLMENNAKT